MSLFFARSGIGRQKVQKNMRIEENTIVSGKKLNNEIGIN
jgi:hypothetical protein